jgi:hypothetical protein
MQFLKLRYHKIPVVQYRYCIGISSYLFPSLYRNVDIFRSRYGEQTKTQRAKKANRLPPGTAYTVSAVPVPPQEDEPLPGPSGEGPGRAGRGRGAGRSRGAGRGRGGRSSSTSDEEDEYDVDDFDDEDSNIIHTDYMGADPDEESFEDDSSEEDDTKGEEDKQDEAEKEEEEAEEEQEEEMSVKESEKEKLRGREKRRKEKETYEVGEFVTAVYEGQWLLAQVDIDQDQAGEDHVNLTYMTRVGKNQFKWPTQHDQLLTLREDILTKCCAPTLVGSTIRASHVGLSVKDAAEADAALVLVVYLQIISNFVSTLFLSTILKIFFQAFLTSTLLRNNSCAQIQEN